MEAFETLEFLGYFVGFWTILFSATYRRQQLGLWRQRGGAGRCFMVIEGSIATFCGTLPVLLTIALLAT